MSVLDEPPPPTLGTLQAIAKDFQDAEGKTGMEYVVAKLRALNNRYCWTPGLRNKAGTNWGQVNRHLWRIQAMYHGGDCFLAGWPGAFPHQALYPKGALCNPAYADRFPKRVRKNRFGCSLVGYRSPAPGDSLAWDEKKWAAVLERPES